MIEWINVYDPTNVSSHISPGWNPSDEIRWNKNTLAQSECVQSERKFGKKGGGKLASWLGDIWCGLEALVFITLSLSCQDKLSILISISKFHMDKLCRVCILKRACIWRTLRLETNFLSNINLRCLYLGGENAWDSPLTFDSWKGPNEAIDRGDLILDDPNRIVKKQIYDTWTGFCCCLGSKQLFAGRIVQRCLLHFRFANASMVAV